MSKRTMCLDPQKVIQVASLNRAIPVFEKEQKKAIDLQALEFALNHVEVHPQSMSEGRNHRMYDRIQDYTSEQA